MLPYFKRSEDQERGADDYHGAGGPLGVADVRLAQNTLCDAFIDACEAAGIPRSNDFNGARQEGAGYFQLTNRNGRRCSSAVAFLHPIRSRPNLTVITNALVHGLELEGKRATGVRYARNGQVETAGAAREVILAAGAIGSPHILELSGIGSGAVLKAAGVPVRHELAGVGENLQDHLQVRFIYACTAKGSLNDVWHSRWQQMLTGIEYALKRSGILTIGAGAVGAFARSRPDVELPDIQFHFLPLERRPAGAGSARLLGRDGHRVPAAPREPRHDPHPHRTTRRRRPASSPTIWRSRPTGACWPTACSWCARWRASRPSPAMSPASICRARRSRARRR